MKPVHQERSYERTLCLVPSTIFPRKVGPTHPLTAFKKGGDLTIGKATFPTWQHAEFAVWEKELRKRGYRRSKEGTDKRLHTEDLNYASLDYWHKDGTYAECKMYGIAPAYDNRLYFHTSMQQASDMYKLKTDLFMVSYRPRRGQIESYSIYHFTHAQVKSILLDYVLRHLRPKPQYAPNILKFGGSNINVPVKSPYNPDKRTKKGRK